IVFIITIALIMFVSLQAAQIEPFDVPPSEVGFFITSSYELGLRCFIEQLGVGDGNLVLGDEKDLNKQGEDYLLKTQEVLPTNVSVFHGREVVNNNENIVLELLNTRVSAFITKDFGVQIDDGIYELEKIHTSVPVRLKYLMKSRDSIKKVDPLQLSDKHLDLDTLRSIDVTIDVYQKGEDSLVVFNDNQSVLRNVDYKYGFIK
ncbi:MAG: hypothetical protein QF632_00840, partial [Candidatus Woesearchaeota archaeon]|nr:hypothetical protein [Candidatus Woesearchaeota archaeon]